MKLLILNGSPSGAQGNCAALIDVLKKHKLEIKPSVVSLARTPYDRILKKKMIAADAILIVTGTYWDSWGSPLQKFLEDATALEAEPELIGKPVGVVVLMHSVGGKGVLSRLQGVLSTFGFLIPPFTGMTLSLAGQLAQEKKSVHADDFWSLQDLETVIENLRLASGLTTPWKAWPVDRKNFKKKWLR